MKMVNLKDYLKNKLLERDQRLIDREKRLIKEEEEYDQRLRLQAEEAQKGITKLSERQELKKKIAEYEALRTKHSAPTRMTKFAEGVQKFGEGIEKFRDEVGKAADSMADAADTILPPQTKKVGKKKKLEESSIFGSQKSMFDI